MFKFIFLNIYINKILTFFKTIFKFKRRVFKNMVLFNNTNELLIREISLTIDNAFKNNIFNIVLYTKLKSIRKIFKSMVLSKLKYIHTLSNDDLIIYIYTIVEEIIISYEMKITTDFYRLTNEYIGDELYNLVYEQLFKPQHDKNIKFIFDTSWIYIQSNINTNYKLIVLMHIFDIAMKIAIVDMELIINNIDLTKYENCINNVEI